MTKIKVETTGEFMLLDTTNAQVVEAFGETEVELTSFIESELAAGRLKQTGGAKVDHSEPRNPGSDPKPVEDVALPDPLVEHPEAEEAEDEKPAARTTRKK